jgi:hypothetical protein
MVFVRLSYYAGLTAVGKGADGGGFAPSEPSSFLRCSAALPFVGFSSRERLKFLTADALSQAAAHPGRAAGGPEREG